MAAKKVTLGSLIDALFAQRAEIKVVEAQKKELEEQAEAIEARLIEKADSEKLTGGRGTTCQASVNDVVVPQVVDWDKYYDFIHENRWYHLLQRRPSVPGCRELFEAGKDIPGVEKFVRRRVNLRGL
jgi:hypothetical protein